MLIPFEINYDRAKELGIPLHVVEWHRIRILKEIDDIRYMAMSDADIDLNAETLISLKKMKLLSLYNPRFSLVSGVYVVSSYDRVVEVYDVSLAWLKKAAEDMANYLARNNLIYDEPTELFTSNQPRVVASGDGLLFGFIFGTAAKKNLDLYPIIPMNDSLYVTQVANFPSAAIGKDFYQIIDTYYKSIWGRWITEPVLKYVLYYSSANDLQRFPSVRHVPRTLTSVYYYDINAENLPEYLKIKAIEGYIATKAFESSLLVPSVNYLMGKSGTYSQEEAGYEALWEPNTLLFSEFFGNPLYPTNVALADYNNKYYATVTTGIQSYGQWYKKKKITKPDGRTYILPYGTFYFMLNGLVNFPHDAQGRVCVQAGGTSTPRETFTGKSEKTILDYFLKFFYDNNSKSFNFHPYFPKSVINGECKVRNGILFANASKGYELEFLMFPGATMEKLETFIFLQESIQALKKDVEEGFYTPVGSPAEAAPATSWYYYEDGVQKWFVHPLTLKNYDVNAFIMDMIFDAGQIWAQIQKEIQQFIAIRKQENESFYISAYQKYLLGEATLLGADAVAEYERKLQTGIFYRENGFDYWRPFSALELKVIQIFKDNAVKNAEIEKINLQIISQNKVYLDQVNQSIIDYNKTMMAAAQVIAADELKRMANAQLAAIVAPTIDELIADAELNGGFPTDALYRWTIANPYYFIREDLSIKIDILLKELTLREQQVATSMIADVINEVKFTEALQEMFEIKE